MLRLVQGHPKLLELADAAANDPATLASHLAAAESAADGTALAAFFTTGETTLDADGFLHALTGWTASVAATLPAASRLLMQLLAGMEDDDRWSQVLEGNWADLWQRLDQPGDPPDLPTTLAPLVAAALLHPETPVAAGGDADTDSPVRYRLHPGVADAIHTATPAEVRTAIDTELAAYWNTVARWAIERDEGEHSLTVVHAGLAAAPYLLRHQQWDTAGHLLDQVLRRDQSPAVALAAAAHLHRIVDATGTAAATARLARAVARVDQAEAEGLFRVALNQAIGQQDFRLASSVVGALIDLLRNTGRVREALDLTDRKVEYTRLAGLGPWTQLTDRGRRLQLLYLLGQNETVLTEVHRQLDQMRGLPEQPADNETVMPWNVRETVLSLGAHAAMALGRWQDALDLNAADQASTRERRASAHDIAMTQFVAYGPLLRLGRLDEAEQLLLGCQQAYEDANDVQRLAKVLSARADLADRRGHRRDAAALEHTALRLMYLRPDPDSIAGSHHNLALYLQGSGTDPAGQLGHRLAAAVIYQLIGQTHDLAGTVRALARGLHDNPDVPTPATVAEVAVEVERTEGVRFAALVTALAGAADTADRALANVLQAAHDLPVDDAIDLQSHLDRWEPRIAAIVAAVGGDLDAAEAIDGLLDQLANTRDWATLVAAVRAILAGQRDPDRLLAGLDPIDTAIVARTLDALAGRVTLNPAPAESPPSPEELVQALAGAIAAAVRGDPDATDAVNQQLDEWAASTDWAALAAALRRVLAGERDHQQLLADLDDVDTRIVEAVLSQLDDPTTRN